MQETLTRKPSLTSNVLHLLAMGFMVLDHLWATLTPSQTWMTCVGRIAFPIFAFLAVEGYFHTHSLRRYLLRLLGLAVLSELPFNLFYEGSLIYPFHQNVIWTFLLGLGAICLLERIRRLPKLWLTIPLSAGVVFLSWLVGNLLMVDYYGAGVLTVLCFYFFHGRKWWCLVGQIAGLLWINVSLLGGRFYPVTLFGVELELRQQALALLALIPIWLYRGEKGRKSRGFQILCYLFYPAHMLLLALLAQL
jgi:hypothetical protein